MQDIKLFLDALGPEELAEELGYSLSAIRRCWQRGVIPSSWAPTVFVLCQRHGLAFPWTMFGWRRSDHAARVSFEPRARSEAA